MHEPNTLLATRSRAVLRTGGAVYRVQTSSYRFFARPPPDSPRNPRRDDRLPLTRDPQAIPQEVPGRAQALTVGKARYGNAQRTSTETQSIRGHRRKIRANRIVQLVSDRRAGKSSGIVANRGHGPAVTIFESAVP